MTSGLSLVSIGVNEDDRSIYKQIAIYGETLQTWYKHLEEEMSKLHRKLAIHVSVLVKQYSWAHQCYDIVRSKKRVHRRKFAVS